jgi:phosphodiesterase/alkaline phosphatase D-like protein
MPEQAVQVQWQVAADDRFRRVVREGISLARPERGHSVHVELHGLRPGREYFYRFRAGGEISPVGRTKTAPAPGADLSPGTAPGHGVRLRPDLDQSATVRRRVTGATHPLPLAR